MRLELDIKPLFESKIATQRISRENFMHSNQYPDFHSNKQTKTMAYQHSMMDLIYGEKVYEEVFGLDFETSKDTVLGNSERDSDANNIRMS